MHRTEKRMAKVQSIRDEEFLASSFEVTRGLLIALPVCAVFWIAVVYTVRALF
jgi:hypothetical protein